MGNTNAISILSFYLIFLLSYQKSSCCYQTRKNPILSYSMRNSLPLPFVCEIHKLKCPQSFLKNTLILRGACITTICLTTQSLQPTGKKLLQKKEALALTESNQSRSLC